MIYKSIHLLIPTVGRVGDFLAGCARDSPGPLRIRFCPGGRFNAARNLSRLM
jgi:hypothetical protein